MEQASAGQSAGAAASGGRRHRAPNPKLFMAIALVVGGVMMTVAMRTALREGREDQRNRFDRAAIVVHEELERLLSESTGYLRGVQAFIRTSRIVEPREFSDFTTSVFMRSKLVGFVDMRWMEVIEDGLEEPKLVTRSQVPEEGPEPSDRTLAFLLAQRDRSADSPAIARFTRAEPHRDEPAQGWLELWLPRDDLEGANESKPWDRTGWLVLRLNLRTMVNHLSGHSGEPVAVDVIRGAESPSETTLATSRTDAQPSIHVHSAFESNLDVYTSEGIVSLRTSALPALSGSSASGTTYIVLAQSIALPGLMIALIWIISRNHQRAEGAAAALDRSRQQYRAIVESQAQMICRSKPDWTVEYVNDAFCQFVGGVPSDYVGKSFAPVVHPGDQQRVGSMLGSLGPREPIIEVESRMIRHDGDARWTRWVVQAVMGSSGQVVAMQGVGSDITRQRDAQQRIIDSEHRFDLAVRGSTDGLWDWNMLTNEVYYSPRFKEMLDYTDEEFPNQFESWTGALHPEDRDRALEALRDHTEDGEPYDVQYRLRTKGGPYRWFRARGEAVRDASGTPTRMAGSIVDITPQKESEERIQRFTLELLETKNKLESQAEELARKSRELEEARQIAVAASQSKTEFLANMSHEIRTPMTAIMGYAELLNDPDQDQDERVQCVETIHRNGEHLLSVINDILDISKIEAGAIAVELLDWDVRAIGDEVCDLLRPRAEEKGLCLEVLCDESLPETIRTDPTRVRQVLVNLVGNAIKFTNKGGVWLLMSMSGDTSDPRRAQVIIDVVDTGIGVEPDKIERLFKPFTQADDSTTREYGGTGLGLTISRRLARMLGGDITVSSVPGGGSQFRVRIAADATEASGHAIRGGRLIESSMSGTRPARSHDEIALSGRILLAEDGTDNQRLLSFILRKAGAEVEIADNGRIAVDRALTSVKQGETFDLILMDMQMPELDGYGATRELRLRGYDMPIVGVTAHGMRGDREKVLDSGCDEYLVKPINRVRLLEACAAWIAEAALRKAA